MKPGDLIFFSGKGWISKGIQLATFSLPGKGFSHVGVIGSLHGEPVLYESTSFERPPCLRLQRKVNGVQCHRLEDILVEDGTTYHIARLRRALYFHEIDRLNYLLERQLGRQYDLRGALRSGGNLVRVYNSLLRMEDRGTLFCSELASFVLAEVGLMYTRNYSQWSPNGLYRWLRFTGVVDKAQPITLDSLGTEFTDNEEGTYAELRRLNGLREFHDGLISD